MESDQCELLIRMCQNSMRAKAPLKRSTITSHTRSATLNCWCTGNVNLFITSQKHLFSFSSQPLSLLNNLFDRSNHVESNLRQVVILTIQNLLESL